jgi:translation initiation factor 2B subunit (eIF-2B alpha/beta/delta family)
MFTAAELESRVAKVAADRESGASTILDEVIVILRTALESAAPVEAVARALCRAQPGMAPVWNAALEAIAAQRSPGRFDRFVQRVARSRAALTRVAVAALAGDAPGVPLRLVTLSFSGTVARTIEAVQRIRPVHLSCSESRPALEGRRLASGMAALGVTVTCLSDAAIASALAGADALLVGADAVTADWFLNKSGTRMLATAAAQQSVPIYVLATREKFVSPAVAAQLTVREHPGEEVWPSAPPGVEVRNPYFESTSLDLVSAVISDAGVLGAGLVPDVCRAIEDRDLALLVGGGPGSEVAG